MNMMSKIVKTGAAFTSSIGVYCPKRKSAYVPGADGATSTKAILIATLAFAALALSFVATAAETAKEKAISEGARQLSSDEIAERLVGQTVTFVSGDKKFLVHYGEDNTVSGKLVGGSWSDTGYYGVTNADRICLSWDKSDKGRLRCMSVLVVDGVVKKFNADGSLNGALVQFEEGKTF